MYDPADRVPYASIGREVIECDAHKKHAYEMAQKSMVLLKNNKNILPLNASKIKRIALIGPNMDMAARCWLTILVRRAKSLPRIRVCRNALVTVFRSIR